MAKNSVNIRKLSGINLSKDASVQEILTEEYFMIMNSLLY